MIVGYALLIVVLLLMAAIGIALVLHIAAPVPYVPTPMRIVRKMVSLADLSDDQIVYDLGAGDARLLIEASKKARVKAVGYEYMPLVWMYGKIRNYFSNSNVTLVCGDAFKADLRDANVVFLYLFPSVMDRLVAKFDTELAPGTRVISHTFVFKHKDPIEVVEVPQGKRVKKLFVYEW